MLLVLLAGTVPFCAFVAERKLTSPVRQVGGAGPSGRAACDRRPRPVGPAAGAVTADTLPAPAARRWTNRRALVLHAVLAVWIPGCALACWWQVTVALSGDALGWVYTVMWPCFAVFGTVVWWNLIHDDPTPSAPAGSNAFAGSRRRGRRRRPRPPKRPGPPTTLIARAEAQDAELAAYNAYLADLGRRAPAKTWRNR